MQLIVATAVAVRRCVRDVFPRVRPLDVVALAAHQRDKFLRRFRVLHALVDGGHEPELPALTLRRDMVLADGHRLWLALGIVFLLLLWLEHRQVELLADHVIAPAQLLDLLVRHVELFARLEVDRVDDEVRVDVLSVGVRADQHLVILEVSGELCRGGVGGFRIDVLALGEALHHVVEQHAALLVVNLLGAQEILIDGVGAAVDSCDQLPALPLDLILALGILHHCGHTAARLTALVVSEGNDCHRALTFRARPLRKLPHRAARARFPRRRDAQA